MQLRSFVFAVAALAAAACQSPRSTQQASGGEKKLDPAAPVAKVQGTAITSGELDGIVKKELKQLEEQYQQQVYQTRRQALEAEIRKRLVEQKAKAAGLSDEEFLTREVIAKIPQPSEEEMRALYERAKSGPNAQQLPPYDQVKGDIARFIQQQKAQGALVAYYDGLMKEAKVEILLPEYEPPKVQVAADGPSKGPQGAPVTIIEFSDFQCPFCIRAEKTVEELLAAYPDKIRFVYRDFPLPSHDLAPKASEAAYCAQDQGKYWEMHNRLFQAEGKLQPEALKGYARELGLDGAKFDKCLDSGEKTATVETHRKAGDEAGVSGTPAFFINGRPLAGAQPLEAFKKVVDQELAAVAKK